MDKSILSKLVSSAAHANSDALVVLKDGDAIGEWYFEKECGPIECMSVTKSIVALAIGRLLLEKQIKSIDERVWKFFPEWKKGEKKSITIRHLLNHTSGLQDEPITTEIYRSQDFVRFALDAKLSHQPGKHYFYSNKAVNLLPAIVQHVTSERIDKFVGRGIFEPLGVQNFSWALDQAGNAQGMAGLAMTAQDLAKIGQLMLQRGRWGAKQIVDENFVRRCVQPGQKFERDCGLLWWIQWHKPRSYAASGYLGQFLQVYPSLNLVVARQIRESSYKSEKDCFVEFFSILHELALAMEVK